MALKDNLRKVMHEVDISPTELSRLSRIPYRTIQRLINDGEADPRASTLKPIVIALGVSSDMVLFDDDELGKNGDLELLFRELVRFEGRERDTVKDVIRALIIQHKSRELGR